MRHVSILECSKKGKVYDKWTYILEAENHTEYLEHARELAPKDYVIYHDKLQAYANTQWKDVKPRYQPRLTEFPGLPEAAKCWLVTEFKNPEHPLTLIMVGPSRLGKTQWVRSLGKHINF